MCVSPGGHTLLPPVLVEVTRGGVVEARHRGHVAVVDAAGRLLAALGDPDHVTFLRSAAKPFQAMAAVEAGAADRFGLEDAELAVTCASHNGEDAHLEAVRRLLGKLGLDEGALACGVHPPGDAAVRQALARGGAEPGPLHNNCSGNHAGILALARHRGWPVEGYADPAHPVQRALLDAVAGVAGLDPAAVSLATDGCSIPTFGIPLRHAALAFARLARPGEAPGLTPERRRALERVGAAMARHPFLVAGTGRFCTDLMRVTGGRLLGKVGAEGVYGVAAADRGWGIAVKVEDGAARGLYPAVGRVLVGLGLLTPGEAEALAGHLRPVVRNHRGIEVGEVRAVFDSPGGKPPSLVAETDRSGLIQS